MKKYKYENAKKYEKLFLRELPYKTVDVIQMQ